MVIKNIKRFVTRICGHAAPRQQFRGWEHQSLSRIGKPTTILDIGAASGTLPLLQAFPNAYHVLVEPLEEYSEDIGRVLNRYDGCWFRGAVGATAGTISLSVNTKELTKSSALLRTSLTNRNVPTETRNVPISTIDRVVRELQLEPPFGIKIDTEGYELEVIKGAVETLKDTIFVIAETSVAERFKNGYTFEELVTAMWLQGFKVSDIVDVTRYEDGIKYMDLLFVQT